MACNNDFTDAEREIGNETEHDCKAELAKVVEAVIWG
jgi:hypothetical protein